MDPEDPSEESESPYAHVDFYEILGLDRECTASDVKKAFRKRALETHPDRGGDPEEFKRVGKAKDVLSDPQRRKYYDVYGEDGVEFFERWQSADPNEMLAQVGSGGIVCFCITNLMCVAFLLCFPIFLMVREDDWMWGWVFAPIWVIDALVLLMLATAPLLPYNMGNKSNLLSACMWTEMLQLICFIIWQALVCASLEYPNWIDWIVVFVPIFGVQAIQSVKAIVQCLPEQYQAAARIKTPGSQLGHLAWIAYLSLEQLAAWSAWIVIPLRMDETIDGSWWLVSVPLFILVGFGLYAASRDPRRAKGALYRPLHRLLTDVFVWVQMLMTWTK